MSRLYFCLAFATLVFFGLPHTPALSEEKVVLAECGDQGCACRLTSLTVNDVAIVTGTTPPPNAANMTLVEFEGQYSWSAVPRDDLDLAMGGDGTCELALFSPIVPLDGIWKSSVRVQSITGCLPQVASMVPPLVDGKGATHRINWGGVFHPFKLAANGTAPQMRWTQVRPDHFTGAFPIPASSIVRMTADTTATLTAPDRAEATLALRIAAAPGADANALAMIGMKDCRLSATYDFMRIAQ